MVKYNPELKYVINKSCVMNGVNVTPGDPAPEFSQHQGDLMVSHRFIVLAPDESKQVTDESKQVTDESKQVVEAPEQVATPALAEIRHEGAGWYDVYLGGLLVTEKRLRKEAAEEWCNDQGWTYSFS